MKCLFCENPVPLVQTLVQRGVPFCCEGHKKAYHADTQRLMLARLMETLKRYGYAHAPKAEPAYGHAGEPSPTCNLAPKLGLHPLITS